MAEARMTNGILNRMTRAALLDAKVFEEVEGDKAATGQAIAVVVLSSIMLGIGFISTGGVVGLVFGVILGLISWAIQAWLNYFIGTKVLAEAQTHADWGQVARAMGFAYSPRLLLILLLIPNVQIKALVFVVVTIWVWIAMVVAVRQALDYKSTIRAVAVTFVGALISGLVGWILTALIGGGAGGGATA